MIEQNRRGLLTGMALSTAGLAALAGVAMPYLTIQRIFGHKTATTLLLKMRPL